MLPSARPPLMSGGAPLPLPLPPPPSLEQLLAQQALAAQQRPPLHMSPPPAAASGMGAFSPMASPQSSPSGPPPLLQPPPLRAPVPFHMPGGMQQHAGSYSRSGSLSSGQGGASSAGASPAFTPTQSPPRVLVGTPLSLPFNPAPHPTTHHVSPMLSPTQAAPGINSSPPPPPLYVLAAANATYGPSTGVVAPLPVFPGVSPPPTLHTSSPSFGAMRAPAPGFAPPPPPPGVYLPHPSPQSGSSPSLRYMPSPVFPSSSSANHPPITTPSPPPVMTTVSPTTASASAALPPRPQSQVFSYNLSPSFPSSAHAQPPHHYFQSTLSPTRAQSQPLSPSQQQGANHTQTTPPAPATSPQYAPYPQFLTASASQHTTPHLQLTHPVAPYQQPGSQNHSPHGMRPLQLADSTRDYPLSSPASSGNVPAAAAPAVASAVPTVASVTPVASATPVVTPASASPPPVTPPLPSVSPVPVPVFSSSSIVQSILVTPEQMAAEAVHAEDFPSSDPQPHDDEEEEQAAHDGQEQEEYEDEEEYDMQPQRTPPQHTQQRSIVRPGDDDEAEEEADYVADEEDEYDDDTDEAGPLPVFEPHDLLGRLCGGGLCSGSGRLERVRADDLDFWRACMDGLEWALFDTQAPEVQRLLAQYCRALKATAAKTRNLHALILVIARHLENYSQTLHLMGTAFVPNGGGEGGNKKRGSGIEASLMSPFNAGVAASASRDHVWVTRLLFFLRIFMQYLLTHHSYEQTLRFFAHLSVPDTVSKPSTPHAGSPPNGLQAPASPYSSSVHWASFPPAGSLLSPSSIPSSPGGGANAPLKHVFINLNPNSRRGSVVAGSGLGGLGGLGRGAGANSADILTRLMHSIVGMMEVLGDAQLNQAVAAAKPTPSAGGAGSSSSNSHSNNHTLPLSSPNNNKHHQHHHSTRPSSLVTPSSLAAGSSGSGLSPTSSSAAVAKGSHGNVQALSDLHLELLNCTFVLLSTQMYLPLSTDMEQVFLDRLMFPDTEGGASSSPDEEEQAVRGFVAGLLRNFTEILPQDYAVTVFQRAQQAKAAGGSNGHAVAAAPGSTSPAVGSSSSSSNAASSSSSSSSSNSAPSAPGLLRRLTSHFRNLFYYPLWALRYLFTLPPSHPIMDRSLMLLELMVYQSGDNKFRRAVRGVRDADCSTDAVTGTGEATTGSNGSNGVKHLHPPPSVTPIMPSPLSPPNASRPNTASPPSALCVLDQLSLGFVSFSKLYYALCSSLLSEHANLLLYTLLAENTAFKSYVLRAHAHDLDYMLMPQLEVLYREVDISKHHVYMIINEWILLSQTPGFEQVVRGITVKEVPFFKEAPLKQVSLSNVMQIVLLRTLQLNLRTKLKEPHIFNNCLAAFCNLTITALIGAPTLPVITTPTSSPNTKPMASPGANSSSVGGLLSLPLVLHPQVCFRLVRVLCLLSRKFLSLQVRHSELVATHNNLVELLGQTGREALTAEEEEDEVALEDLGEELGTCMEFIQLLLEVVNHCIVHAMPTHPPQQSTVTQTPAARRSFSQQGDGGTTTTTTTSAHTSSPSMSSSRLYDRSQDEYDSEQGVDGSPSPSPLPFHSALSGNAHLLFHLIACRGYFIQLEPYAHLFEAHLVSNVTSTIRFYEQTRGLEITRADMGAMGCGGGGVDDAHISAAGGRSRSTSVSQSSRHLNEREVERAVQVLSKAIERTPMNTLLTQISPLPSPTASPAGGAAAANGGGAHPHPQHLSHALPPSSYPDFDASALIERGPFTYHEQENSQDFFIPYIFQLCQTMRILPRMFGEANAATSPANGQQQSADGATGSPAMGDVDADAQYLRDLHAEEEAQAAQAAASMTTLEHFDDDGDFEPTSPTEADRDEFTGVRIAIK